MKKSRLTNGFFGGIMPINYNLKENGGGVFLFEKRNRKTFLKGEFLE